jgi:polar amino acid transport system substrate-binding protein
MQGKPPAHKECTLYAAIRSFPLLAAFFLMALLPLSARADGGLQRMRTRGVLRVATDATYPPFEFMQNEKIVGFDQEIGDEIGRELGVPVEYVSMEWSGVFASLGDRAVRHHHGRA